MGPKWYDDACDQLAESVNNGEISDAEFHREMRELNAELRDAAEDAAENAYHGFLDG